MGGQIADTFTEAEVEYLNDQTLGRIATVDGDNNLSGELSLEEMAHQASLSVRHFHRLFKTSTGMSTNQYGSGSARESGQRSCSRCRLRESV